jgi:hypothetical protein
MSDTAILYRYAPALKAAPDFHLRVNGRQVFVHDSHFGAFAAFGARGPVTIEIEHATSFERVKVRPLSRGIVPAVDGRLVRFALPGPMKLSVELDDGLVRLAWRQSTIRQEVTYPESINPHPGP